MNRFVHRARLWLAAQLAPTTERPFSPAAAGGATLMARRKHVRKLGS